MRLQQMSGPEDSSKQPQTGRKTLMPRRGRAPGLKRGRHNLPYWIAKQIVRDPMGYPDICVPLPAAASEDELVELCQQHTARLRAWIAERSGEPGQPTLTRTKYDGSMKSACQ